MTPRRPRPGCAASPCTPPSSTCSPTWPPRKPAASSRGAAPRARQPLAGRGLTRVTLAFAASWATV
ncbi:hypothetical protein ACU686_33045 [Yinghuangia aomiensis]